MGEQNERGEQIAPTENEKKIIVEVGTRYGMPFFYQGTKKINEENSYIFIDKELDRAAKPTAEHLKAQGAKNALSTNADAAEMPLKDSSIDEIIFNNVFGEHEIGDTFHYNTDLKAIEQGSYLKILEEAARVLKKGGKIVITETYSPEGMPDEMRVRIRFGKAEVNEDYYKKFGFKVFKITTEKKDVDEYHRNLTGGLALQLILEKI